jgi:NADH-quinone oxidoreductase subunit F
MEEKKNITKLWNKINPFLIESYISEGGYQVLSDFLKTPKTKKEAHKAREKIMRTLEASGLRGRGGAGFLTSKKWKMALDNSLEKKKPLYLVVNGNEAQPGSFKDSFLMKKNPHLIIESIALAAYALGSKKAILYLNGNFREELAIMKQALMSAREHDFLKGEFLKSGKEIKIEIFQGVEGYVYGEETALINVLEGNLEGPQAKPPFPTQKGYRGCPTVVNNLETIVNLVSLLEMGPKAYKNLGEDNSSGTKLFSVSGSVKNPGVFEFPLGVTLKEIIYGVCGGPEKGKKIAFVQAGRFNNFFSEKELNYRLVYEEGKGKIPVGTGDIFVVDKNAALEDLLLSWAQFYQRESCGKCTPCREGTYQLLKIAERSKDKNMLEKDYENLKDILEVMEKTSLCPLGNFAAQPWRGIIKFYGENFFLERKKNKR